MARRTVGRRPPAAGASRATTSSAPTSCSFDPDALLARGTPRETQATSYDVDRRGRGHLRPLARVADARQARAGARAGGGARRRLEERRRGRASTTRSARPTSSIPIPTSEDARERRTFSLLEELGLRARGEDLARDRTRQRRLSGDGNHCIFSNARVLPEAEVYSGAQQRASSSTCSNHDRYPSVPATDTALVEALDRVSFRAFLKDAALQRKIYGRSVGAISPRGWEAIEYYFWGAFGTTPAETSAYHGLNFFAAEYGAVLVYPGGNGFITRRLAERLTAQSAGPREDRCVGAARRARRGRERRLGRVLRGGRTRAVPRAARRLRVAAVPRAAAGSLVARRTARRHRLARLPRLLVANVFLSRTMDEVFANPAFRGGYELTRVHGVDPAKAGAQALSTRKAFSDVVVADLPGLAREGRRGADGLSTVSLRGRPR